MIAVVNIVLFIVLPGIIGTMSSFTITTWLPRYAFLLLEFSPFIAGVYATVYGLRWLARLARG